MGLSTSERVGLLVRCGNADCGKSVEKPLAWLVVRNSMECPACGGAIDLQSGDNGLRIQKLAQACASIDADLGKLT